MVQKSTKNHYYLQRFLKSHILLRVVEVLYQRRYHTRCQPYGRRFHTIGLLAGIDMVRMNGNCCHGRVASPESCGQKLLLLHIKNPLLHWQYSFTILAFSLHLLSSNVLAIRHYSGSALRFDGFGHALQLASVSLDTRQCQSGHALVGGAFTAFRAKHLLLRLASALTLKLHFIVNR